VATDEDFTDDLVEDEAEDVELDDIDDLDPLDADDEVEDLDDIDAVDDLAAGDTTAADLVVEDAEAVVADEDLEEDLDEDLEDDEEDVADEEEEEDVEEEESLDVLLAREKVLDDDDVGPARGTTTNVTISAGDFTCRSCFLVKRRAQLADEEKLICLDCA